MTDYDENNRKIKQQFVYDELFDIALVKNWFTDPSNKNKKIPQDVLDAKKRLHTILKKRATTDYSELQFNEGVAPRAYALHTEDYGYTEQPNTNAYWDQYKGVLSRNSLMRGSWQDGGHLKTKCGALKQSGGHCLNHTQKGRDRCHLH